MKASADLVRGWISKADSDLGNARLCLAVNASLNTRHGLFYASFSQMKTSGRVTPYAVQLRYDEDFWPAPGEATTALQAAEAFRAFIIPRLPSPMQHPRSAPISTIAAVTESHCLGA